MQTFIIACLFPISVAVCAASDPSGQPGKLEGHLNIVASPKPVELSNEGLPQATEKIYPEYSLVIRTGDGKREITRVTVDTAGNYQVALPPGDYLLDVQHRRLVRATPKRFTVTSKQTIRVDLDLDTGVR